MRSRDAFYARVRSDLQKWGRSWDSSSGSSLMSSPPRPYVTLTYAQSVDGSIAARRGEPLLISGKESLVMTHFLRSVHEGILVGVGTVASDNPSLTVRHVKGPNPRPVIIDTHARTPVSCKLLTSDSGALARKPTIIVCKKLGQDFKGSQAELTAFNKRKMALRAAGAVLVECVTDESGSRVSLPDALKSLAGAPFALRSLMVEGGASIIQSFLRDAARVLRKGDGAKPHVDQAIVTIAPVVVGGLNPYPPLASTSSVSAFPRFKDPEYAVFGADIVLRGQLGPSQTSRRSTEDDIKSTTVKS